MKISASTPLSLRQPAATTSSAEPAKFLDMYRASITSAIDTDADGKVSQAEYERQLVGSGASADDAFAKTIEDPFGNERDQLLKQIINELKAGQGAGGPSGNVLDAAGQVADPHATLRYLAAMFPGNMQY